jgi:hypothetical protein
MSIAAVITVLCNIETVSVTRADVPVTVRPVPSDHTAPAPTPAPQRPDPTSPDDQTQTMTCDEFQCSQHCAALGHCDIGCDVHGVCRCDTGPPC